MDIAIIAIYVLTLFVFNKRIIREPRVGLWFWIVLLLIQNFVKDTPSIKLILNIKLSDIIFVYFFAVAIWRYHRFSFFIKNDGQLRIFTYVLIFFVVSIPLFSFIGGHSFVGSLNAGREFTLFAPAFLYFFSFKYGATEIDRILKDLFLIAFVSSIGTFIMTIKTGGRFTGASFTLFFAYMAIFALIKYYERGKINYLIYSLFLILLVFVLRHRSVWIAMVLGLVYVHLYIKLNTRVLGIIGSVIIVVSLLPVFFPNEYNKFSQKVSESASPFQSTSNFENSTGGGRVFRWKAQIEAKFEWPVLVWGLGHAYDRNIYIDTASGDRRLSHVSFHNHYLEQMFRVGGVSVLVLLLFLFRFLKLNHRLQKQNTDFLLIGISACLFGTIGFGMMYTFHYIFFIVMGIGYSILIKENEDY